VPRSRKAVVESSQSNLPSVVSEVTIPGSVPAPYHRPEPTEELIQDLLRLPMPDLAKVPNAERISEFMQMYRRHCAELLRFGLQGEFNNVCNG
jgi:hypothetical protein